MRRRAAAIPGDRLARVRRRWGANDGENIILFASECGAEMAEQGLDVPYEELAYLDRLIELVCRSVAFGPVRSSPDRSLVVIRPHPKDRSGKYAAYLGTARAPRTVLDGERDGIVSVLAADAVVGMDSSLLYEAAALDRPVMSLIPGHALAAAPGQGGQRQ